MKKLLIAILAIGIAMPAAAQRSRTCFDQGWMFALGDASSPAADFGHGTEYFNYLTKAASIHNEGPYSPKFDASKYDNEWVEVDLPHDWVVDLPFAQEASHSHGYKTVGHKYPASSIGWYRKNFTIPASEMGKHITVTFDGIFRDSHVWVNGFYLGGEPSGYLPQTYDITEYLNYGGDNLITVRADATFEEGWFYEGAGIYRHVWLDSTDKVHVAENGVFIHPVILDVEKGAKILINTTVANDLNEPASYSVSHKILDAEGIVVAESAPSENMHINSRTEKTNQLSLTIDDAHLWDIDNPYLYKVVTEVKSDKGYDSYTSKMGIRSVVFDHNDGFLLNGKPIKLKGVNMHQDHAGTGAAIPDALQIYRLKRLKDYGVNAYRASHNPPTPEVLDACDSLGIVVIDENRLLGVNKAQTEQLRRMIMRDRNHPSVILYSVGNEEWGVEWNEFGSRIVETMREFCHNYDPSRLMTVASSSGPTVLVPADVAGYNYIMQNPVEQYRADYPLRKALGTEETSGCGTRGIYYDDIDNGRMKAINRGKAGADSCINCIERGWKFYADRPWLGGLFYWTGFDYRGEPNPLSYPATGSEFGIFDYCGFPKDEAYYLKSWWTDTPTLHILPHWNLTGHEGEPVSVWVYSNCDEVELIVNGKKMGRKAMPANGHLEWDAVYKPGYVRAIGYNNGRKVLDKRIDTTGDARYIDTAIDRNTIKRGTADIAICDITLTDAKRRFVPDACLKLTFTVDGPVRIMGAGNGDPAFRSIERPVNRDDRSFSIDTFNGNAQLLLSPTASGVATVTISGEGLESNTFTITVE